MRGSVLLSLLGACTASTPATDPPTPGSDPIAEVVIALEQAWEVETGDVRAMTREVCEMVVVDGVACPGGPNLSSSYGMWTFPGDLPSADGNLTLQLGTDEVVVFLGATPPDSRYFSYTLYQYRRRLPDGEDHFGRGSIAASLHHQNIHVDPRADSAFSAFSVVMVASSPALAARAQATMAPVLEAYGLDTAVNTLALPARTAEESEALDASGEFGEGGVVHFKLGHGPRFDDYMVNYRVTDPVDPAHAFFTDPSRVGTLLRLRTTESVDLDSFDYPHLPPDSFTGEVQGEAIREARDALALHVQETFKSDRLASFPMASLNEERKSGPRCNNGLTECFLNSDDARYIRDTRAYKLRTEDSAFYLVGVVHDAVRSRVPTAPDVSYSNLSIVNREPGSTTVVSWMDDVLRGSAAAWLPDGVEGVDPEDMALLYVVKVARHCGDADPLCYAIPEDAIGFDEKIGWTERIYLNEGSGTAPDEGSVWGPVAVGIGPVVTETPLWVGLD